MSDLFGRAIEVLIGKPGFPGRLITGIRIAFKVEKQLEKNPNAAKIQLYNLSRETRALCEEKGTVIRLSAGYSTNPKLLFVGDVARVTTKHEGPNISTEIEAGDGEQAYQSKNSQLSFKPGTTVGQILDKLVSEFGLTQGVVMGLDRNDQYQNGASFSGSVRDHLDKVLKKQGLNWSIQDNQLQILAENTAASSDAILLSPSTGLIGSPFKTTLVNADLVKSSTLTQFFNPVQEQNTKPSESGVQVTSLLNADFKPGYRFQLESDLVNGVFMVKKVSHEGDTHGQQWYSVLEALA